MAHRGSGGAFSALCGSADVFTCFVFAGGGGGAGGGGDEPGDNGGNGGSWSSANGTPDGAGATDCASGGAGGANGGGGGDGYTNNGGSANGSNAGEGGEGGTSDDRNAGGGGGGGGGLTGGGGGGGNDSYDGFGCSGGGGGGAGSSACEAGYYGFDDTTGFYDNPIPVTYDQSCAYADSGLADSGLNENTSGQITVGFSGYVAPPPITASGSGTLDFTYGQAVNTSLTSLSTVRPTFTEEGTLPNGITFDNGVLSGTPTTTGSYPIEVTASDSFGSSSRP